jgi:hypothetical protein
MVDPGIGRSEIFEHEFDQETREILSTLKMITERVQREHAQGDLKDLMRSAIELGQAVKQIKEPHRVIIDLLALVDAMEQKLIQMSLEGMEGK